MKTVKMRKISVRRPSSSNSPLENYLLEIHYIPMLSPDEEMELVAKIRQGGEEGEWAKAKLIRHNLRFVAAIAKHYQNQGLTPVQLIKEGNKALEIAVRRYVEGFVDEKGFKFLSYAVWWIRQGILQAIAEKKRCANDNPTVSK